MIDPDPIRIRMEVDLKYAARASADLDRLTDFHLQAEPVATPEVVGLITEAVQDLENHPLNRPEFTGDSNP